MKYTLQELIECIHGKTDSLREGVVNHVSVDSRSVQNSAGTVFFALETDKRDGHQFIPDLVERGVTVFVVSKEITISDSHITTIRVHNTLEALQKLAQYHRQKYQIPVIGITGSYGKTIVKEWLYQLLSPDFLICRSPKSFNSQIGVPLSVLLLNETHTLGIFEAGISEVGEMEKLESILKPSIGVLTRMGEAHQDGFVSLEQKEKEKVRLFKNVTERVTFESEIEGFEFPFTDKSSVENCKICIAVMQKMGYTRATIQSRISHLSPLALRLEMKKGVENSTIINDGYNISYSSLVLSLEYLNAQANNFPKTVIITEIPETPFSDPKFVELLNVSGINRLLVVGSEKITGIDSSIEVAQFYSTTELLAQLKEYEFRDHYVLIKGSRNHRLEQVAKVLEEKNHRTVLEINLNQLAENLAVYRKKINPTTKLMVMVKAFAYGSGATEIPRFLEQEKVDYLGVAYTDEGITLRKKGVLMPIVVMNPEPETFMDLIKYDLEPEVYSLEMLDELVKDLIVSDKKEYPIHIKIETGMNRLGFLPTQLPQLVQYLYAQPEVYVKSVFSHLSSADDPNERAYTENQLEKYEQYSSYLINQFSYPIHRHVLNTAGIENYNDFQYDMVRLGIGLYGINVGNEASKIKPISRLKTVVIQTKELEKGDSIGYGRKTKAQGKMTIAMLPIGYSDGMRRSLGNRNFSFYWNDSRCDIVGNICMDVCMIEVTGLEVKVGDEIEIFGKHNKIEDLAEAMDTIPYEVLTSISQRVKRVFYKD